MSDERNIRINKVLRELNISLDRAVDFLKEKGISIDSNPNAKISEKEFDILPIKNLHHDSFHKKHNQFQIFGLLFFLRFRLYIET